MAYRKPTGRITLRIITHNKKPGSTAEMWVVGHLDPDGENSSRTHWWGSEPRARRDPQWFRKRFRAPCIVANQDLLFVL